MSLVRLPLLLLSGRKSGLAVRWGTYVLGVSDGPVIQQAFRFALDPTVEQERFLGACAGASRFWFNQGLALVKQRLDERAAGVVADVPWSYESLCVAFRGDIIKDQLAPWRAEVVTDMSGSRGSGRRAGPTRLSSSSGPGYLIAVMLRWTGASVRCGRKSRCASSRGFLNMTHRRGSCAQRCSV